MRIDISLRGVSKGDMEYWASLTKDFAEDHRGVQYALRYGDDWEDRACL